MEYLDAIPWSAVTALLGTWLGHFLSAQQQAKQENRQQKYADSTRFHIERRDVYSEFLASLLDIRSIRKMVDRGDVTFADDVVRQPLLEARRRLIASHAQITLIGTAAIRQAAGALFKYGGSAATPPTEEDHAPVDEDEGGVLTVNFEQLARQELGVDHPNE